MFTSCTNYSQEWSHPNRLKNQWNIDTVNCANRAGQLAEKNLKSLSLRMNNNSGQNNDNFFHLMDIHDAKIQRQKIFYTCLKKLGYIKVDFK